VRVSITSPFTQPSPNGRRVGIRIDTFEACPGFTHVTTRHRRFPVSPQGRGRPAVGATDCDHTAPADRTNSASIALARAALPSGRAPRRGDSPSYGPMRISVPVGSVPENTSGRIIAKAASRARPAAHRSLGRGRTDRGDHDQDRSQGRKRARHALLSQGHQGQQGPDEMPRHRWRSVPS
jgi:hypothetical protein